MDYDIEFVNEFIPGLYFRADNPKRKSKILIKTGLIFFSEPAAYPNYQDWCVIPFKGKCPKGIKPVGELEIHTSGSLDKNEIGQVKGMDRVSALTLDSKKYKFSTYCYAVKDKDLPERLEETDFVFDPENILNQ